MIVMTYELYFEGALLSAWKDVVLSKHLISVMMTVRISSKRYGDVSMRSRDLTHNADG